MPVQTNLNEFNCSCFRHIINILLTKLSQSVWENLDFGRVHRPYCVRSVLTTSVRNLPYRPPARLIRAKYGFWTKIYLTILITANVGDISYAIVMAYNLVKSYRLQVYYVLNRRLLQLDGIERLPSTSKLKPYLNWAQTATRCSQSFQVDKCYLATLPCWYLWICSNWE